jgi:hypothetical protein
LLLAGLPLFDSVVPTRLSLVVIPVVGVLLALFVDWLMIHGGPDTAAAADGPAAARRFWAPYRVLGAGALAMALLPIVPTSLPVTARQPAPRFITSGAWRDRVPEGSTVGVLPFGWQNDVNSMQWQTEQGFRFKILGGYFLGPDPAREDKRAGFGAGGYFVRTVLGEGRDSRMIVTDEQRAHCLAQLRGWRADVLLLPADAPNAEVVRGTAEQILGPGQRVEDVWIWRVHRAA